MPPERARQGTLRDVIQSTSEQEFLIDVGCRHQYDVSGFGS